MEALAVEKAERISDREIIESLAELKAGQKALDKRLDDMNLDMNRRFDDMNQGTNRRFDDINRRIDDIMTLLQILIGVLSAVGVGVFGVLLLMWRKISRLEGMADEVTFLKDMYLKLQEQMTYLLKPTRETL